MVKVVKQIEKRKPVETAKIKKVVAAFEEYTSARARYKNLNTIMNPGVPSWKLAKMNKVKNNALKDMINSQSAPSKLFDKLTRREKEDLTEIRKGVIH